MQTRNAPVFQPLRPAPGRAPPARRPGPAPVVGAGLGLLLFLLVGLLPSLVLGGSAGAQLALGLLGVQDSSSLAFDGIMILGVLAATAVGAAFFAILGAAGGAALSELTRARSGRGVTP